MTSKLKKIFIQQISKKFFFYFLIHLASPYYIKKIKYKNYYLTMIFFKFLAVFQFLKFEVIQLM